MPTFGELLTRYTARTGISDAELARSLGVRRQTIFRWKEGETVRPRSREDVLRCATRLRLTDEERDGLLLAAGFAPEGSVPAPPLPEGTVAATAARAGPDLPAPDERPAPATHLGSTDSEGMPGAPAPPGLQRSRAWLRWSPWYAVVAVALLLVLAGGLWALGARRTAYPVAAAGERLIVIGQFTNYAGGGQGYNVAGRLQAALEREVGPAEAGAVRVVVWPGELRDREAARQASRQARAALVIWGEYDSGRVLSHFLVPEDEPDNAERDLESLLNSPDNLASTINTTLPNEVRSLALLSLARLDVEAGELGRAHDLLEAAADGLPAAPDTQTSLFFWLGYVSQNGSPRAIDESIAWYSRALGITPGLVSSYNNRAAAYLTRAHEGDAALAVADLDRALALLPDATPMLYNRALAYIRLADTERAAADLARVLAVDGRHAGAQSALCWAYALDARPAAALPHCEQAVALEGDESSRDSRAIVYAQLGRSAEAIADLEAYLGWLQTQPPELRQQQEPRRQAWLAELRAGRSPFSPQTLAELRAE